jgi:3-oxoacyl-[acyl-carrier-protein] synthase III
MMFFKQVRLHSYGYELPERELSSAQIEYWLTPLYERLKLPKGRLELMSGITTRRLWEPPRKPSQAAAGAGRNALARAGVDPGEIECLICTSVSRDMLEPATASFVHHELGLSSRCLIYDLSNACLGFLDGMLMLATMIDAGNLNNGLIVSGETAEDLIESTIAALLADPELTRKDIKPAFASLTIGSGAVAWYLCKTSSSTTSMPLLSHGCWRAQTNHIDLCQGDRYGGSTTLMATNSEELLVQGVETAQLTWHDFIATGGWELDEIDHYFCHQVGSAHARLLMERLALDPAKNFETLATLGNVGSVSAPLTMALAMEQEVFRPGQKAALLGIGSGINCLMAGVTWPS